MTEPGLVALDTNILVYAEGLNDLQRHRAAVEVIAALGERIVALPAQCLGELFSAMVRKFGRPPRDACERVSR
ncbi:PIN domain-containing protein [Salinarimonas soli]|uniref:PIN domain-containing protein n=1 Tax=Salinarimonas soli TaxID=1638099 RepID=A0A5B2VGZ9_9HYPH|nr:PIN domain-containing protein [Salinarimonas soli]KAA2237898.1 PIN domain-containing protein [Salinarimonas soli]